MLLIASAVFATEEEEKPKTTPTNSSNEVAVIKTSEGDMVIQFWTDAAPNTVENFKKLARQGFYDGTTFHRIVKGFMIQGGDPNSKDPAKENSYGQGGPGYNIKAEFNDHSHDLGVISMARGAPDSATSGWFICINDQPSLDFGGQRNPDGQGFAAFGRVVSGMDVVRKIQAAPSSADRKTNTEAQRLTPPIKILKVARLP